MAVQPERHSQRQVDRIIIVAFLMVSAAVGGSTFYITTRFFVALIATFAAMTILISVYALLAMLLGWPKLKWNDATATEYMLP